MSTSFDNIVSKDKTISHQATIQEHPKLLSRTQSYRKPPTQSTLSTMSSGENPQGVNGKKEKEPSILYKFVSRVFSSKSKEISKTRSESEKELIPDPTLQTSLSNQVTSTKHVNFLPQSQTTHQSSNLKKPSHSDGYVLKVKQHEAQEKIRNSTRLVSQKPTIVSEPVSYDEVKEGLESYIKTPTLDLTTIFRAKCLALGDMKTFLEQSHAEWLNKVCSNPILTATFTEEQLSLATPESKTAVGKILYESMMSTFINTEMPQEVSNLLKFMIEKTEERFENREKCRHVVLSIFFNKIIVTQILEEEKTNQLIPLNQIPVHMQLFSCMASYMSLLPFPNALASKLKLDN